MPNLRLFKDESDDLPVSRQFTDRLGADEFPDRDDPLMREMRSLYAAPGERYWDDLEGKILAAVRTGSAGAARPGRVAADWWQALAGWARPEFAAAAVLLVVATAVGVQARASGAHVADAGVPASQLQPLDPELARALDDFGLDSASADSAEAAREAAQLLTGGLKRRAPVAIPRSAPATQTDARARLKDEAVSAQRARREATFRYVMPD